MTVTATEVTALKSGDMVRVSVSSPVLAGRIGVLDQYDIYEGWLVRPTDGGIPEYVRTRDLTPVTTTEDKVSELVAQLATAMSERDAARTQLYEFKVRVREVLGQYAQDDTDLYEPFNEVLETLGLEELEQDFDVSVSFRGSYNTTVRATSESNAREQISNSAIGQYIVETDNPAYIIDDFETEVE